MAKKTSDQDNLTKITGIGPKIQEHLNAAGFKTYKEIATAKKADLQKVLDDAGPRYNAHDPSTWMSQAKELAKGSPAKTAKPKTKKEANTSPKPKPAPKPKPKPKPKSKSKPAPKPKSTPKSRPATSEAASKIKVGELDLPRFRLIMKELNGNVENLTKLTVRKYQKDAQRDAQKLLKSMKRDLRRWTRQLEKGELTTMDFEFLVQSNVASCKMSALETSGIAVIRIHAYRSSVFNIIIDTVFGIALKALA